MSYCKNPTDGDGQIHPTTLSNRDVIFESLSSFGVAKLVVKFDGYGDDGEIESIRAFDGKGGLIEIGNQALLDDIEEIAFDLLAAKYDGWETNDGAFGSFVFAVSKKKTKLKYKERYYAVRTATHSR
jgi:hypothetical protein